MGLKRFSRILMFGGVLSVSACSAIGFGPDTPVLPPPPISGTWAGAWHVDRQDLDGTLVVTQKGNSLTATFRSGTLVANASGSGKVEPDGRLRLELKYRTQCSGTVELDGALVEQGTRLDGVMSASDCTGKASG